MLVFGRRPGDTTVGECSGSVAKPEVAKAESMPLGAEYWTLGVGARKADFSGFDLGVAGEASCSS